MPNKLRDFLKAGGFFSSRPEKKYKKYITIAICLLIIVIIISGVLFLIYQKPATKVLQLSNQAKSSFLTAQDQLIKQDFEAAALSLHSAINDFQTAQDEFKKFGWMRYLPWLGKQIRAIDNLMAAGVRTGQSIEKIDLLALDIIKPLKKNDDISLNSLTEQETRQLLANLYSAKATLDDAKLAIDESLNYLNKVPNKGLIKKINEAAAPLKEQVPRLQQAIDQAISASQIIPAIAGYPEQKTYLFLLQNNTEIRPTGGFIGTYGILKAKDGDIISFNTDNIYNLDQPAEAWLNIEPPFPLTRYNKVFKWFLRDANWSPDFPTTAQQAEWFYHQERGMEKNIDGIIAVTPTFIQSLLTLTGEIKVNGLTFTSTNLVETLQFQVEQGYLRQGLEEASRKEIIGVLSKKILDGVLDLPKSKWPDLWKVFNNDIIEKQILLYSKDDYVQSYILKENWGGAIQDVSSDYISIIDANLASLKSDPGVTRNYSYALRRDDNNLIADLTIHYKNEGTITWKTTRYRTYTRVYVPAGSTLLTSSGMMIDCKIDQEGSVETTEELNKTVFGTFICVEPGEEKTLTFKYRLPDSISTHLQKENNYQLLFQKQAGTADYDLALKINLKKKAQNITGFDNPQIQSDSNILINSQLTQDKTLKLEF